MVVCQCGLRLVLHLLVFSPGLLLPLLFEGQSFVLLLHLLHHLRLLLGGLVLQHSPHARDCLRLLGVHPIVVHLLRLRLILFSHLLRGPFPLVLSVTLHSFMIHYTSFELITANTRFKFT